MLRQYNGPSYKGGFNPLYVGTIPIGAVFYLQDPHVLRRGEAAIRRNPWMVIAWLPRRIEAWGRDKNGNWTIPTYVASNMDEALVQSLRDGRITRIRYHVLKLHEELGLYRDPYNYPDSPDLKLYCRMKDLPEDHFDRAEAAFYRKFKLKKGVVGYVV